MGRRQRRRCKMSRSSALRVLEEWRQPVAGEVGVAACLVDLAELPMPLGEASGQLPSAQPT